MSAPATFWRPTGRGPIDVERSTMVLVGALLLLESTMWSAVTPVLPHYAHTLHASKPALGVFVAMYPAGMVPGSVLSAWIATRAGVRRTTVIGLLVFTASVSAFGFATQIVALDVLRFIQGSGCGLIWGGGLTWAIATAPRERRGSMTASVFAAATFGTLVGPVLGTLATAIGTRAVFAAVGAVSLLVTAWTMRHPAPAPPDHEAMPLRGLFFSRQTLLGFWLILLSAGTIGALGTLLPLRLSRFGASSIVVGATYLASSFTSMLLNRPVGRMIDRRGAAVPLRAGLTVTAAVLAALTLPHAVALLAIIGVVVLGGPLTACITPGMAVITDGVERAGVPLAIATLALNLAWAGGEMTGAPVAAAVSQATSDAVPLLALAAIVLATLVPVVRMRLPAAPVAPGGDQDQPSTGSSVTSRATSAA